MPRIAESLMHRFGVAYITTPFDLGEMLMCVERHVLRERANV